MKVFRILLLLIFVGILGWFMINIIPILPSPYLWMAILGLSILGILLCLSQFSKNKFVSILGKFLILVLCVCLCVVNITYHKTMSLLDNVQVVEEIDAASISVLTSSKIKQFEELKNKTVGVLKGEDLIVDTTKTYIKDYELEYVEYESYEELVKAYYSRKVDAIMINEAYRGFYEEINVDFTNDSRNVYIKEYTTEIKEKEEINKNENENETITKPIVQSGHEVVKKHIVHKNEQDEVIEIDYSQITTNESLKITKDTFSVYISGIDTYGSISTKSRSDVNMIVTINPRSKKILLTSIPRDYYIPFACLGGQRDKLTHSGLYGVNETKRNVANYFGISIPYYVRVNFSSLINIVDAIGGIDIYNPHENFIDLPLGNVHIDGKVALIYARERYAFKGGDGERIKNQMIIITGIINKITNPEIITNYNSLLNSLNGSFQTNLSNNEIVALIRNELASPGGWSIETQYVSGKGKTLYSPIYKGNLYMNVPKDETVKKAASKIASMY